MEGDDREMGKGRTRMNEVSVYMDACVRVWGKGRRESWLLNFTYLACVSDFTYCKSGNVCVKIFMVLNFHSFI